MGAGAPSLPHQAACAWVRVPHPCRARGLQSLYAPSFAARVGTLTSPAPRQELPGNKTGKGTNFSRAVTTAKSNRGCPILAAHDQAKHPHAPLFAARVGILTSFPFEESHGSRAGDLSRPWQTQSRYCAMAHTDFISTVMSRTSRRMFMSITTTPRRNSGLIRCNWRQTLDFAPTNCARYNQ